MSLQQLEEPPPSSLERDDWWEEQSYRWWESHCELQWRSQWGSQCLEAWSPCQQQTPFACSCHHLKKQAQCKNSFNCCIHKYLKFEGKQMPVPPFGSTTSFLCLEFEKCTCFAAGLASASVLSKNITWVSGSASVYLAPLKHLCPLEISGSTIDKLKTSVNFCYQPGHL